MQMNLLRSFFEVIKIVFSIRKYSNMSGAIKTFLGNFFSRILRMLIRSFFSVGREQEILEQNRILSIFAKIAAKRETRMSRR
jgi:hypothetical protein